MVALSLKNISRLIFLAVSLSQVQMGDVFAEGESTPDDNSKTVFIPDHNPAFGDLTVIQTAVSSDSTVINLMVPQLWETNLKVREATKRDEGESLPEKEIQRPQVSWQIVQENLPLQWKIIRASVSNIKPDTTYILEVFRSARSDSPYDQREFKALDVSRKDLNLALLSCISDNFKYAHARNIMWDKLSDNQPDLIIMAGDNVYVDDKDFVDRENITADIIGQRFMSSFRAMPIFKQRRLVPVMATWDDHDYGVNNADKTFSGKKNSARIFRSLLGFSSKPGQYIHGKEGVYKALHLEHYVIYLMDNRYFREAPGSKDTYAHWGKMQHDWLMQDLATHSKAVLLVNGGQFFADAVYISRGDEKIQINESLKADHPEHFKKIIADLKAQGANDNRITFLSGDIHFSEVNNVASDFLGYASLEVTSSPFSAYIFRDREDRSSVWENKTRRFAQKDYNFISMANRIDNGKWQMNIKSIGLAPKPYFEDFFSIDLPSNFKTVKPLPSKQAKQNDSDSAVEKPASL